MNWYAFLIGIGASLGIWRVIQEQEKPQKLHWGFLSLWVLFGGWIGARIAFFIWHPALILDFGWQAFGLREGGMVWPGAIAGAWLSIWLISLKVEKGFLETADFLIVMLPPLVITSWLAGWFSGSAYGQIMPEAWWIPMSIDDTFQMSPRFPLQLVAAFSLFVLFLLVDSRIAKGQKDSRTTILWSIFSFHTLIFSFLRADPRPEWFGIEWDVWFVFLCIIWGLLLWLIWFRQFKKKDDKETSKPNQSAIE